jgi:hypothetical protein
MDATRSAVDQLLVRRYVSHGDGARSGCHCVGCDTDAMLQSLLARAEEAEATALHLKAFAVEILWGCRVGAVPTLDAVPLDGATVREIGLRFGLLVPVTHVNGNGLHFGFADVLKG